MRIAKQDRECRDQVYIKASPIEWVEMAIYGTIPGTQTVDFSKSFYAKVGDDYRISIPKTFREAVGIHEGDIVHVIIGTVIRGRSLYIPGERA